MTKNREYQRRILTLQPLDRPDAHAVEVVCVEETVANYFGYLVGNKLRMTSRFPKDRWEVSSERIQ